MSTETPATAPVPTSPAGSAVPTPPPAQETDWKAEARKWEQRAKENSEAAKRLAEIDEASKTAEQKAAEALTKAQQRIADLEAAQQRQAWAVEVSKATGLPVDILRGSTKEEIEAHAASIKSLIPETPPTKGAIGPYVPPEGGTAGTPATSPGQLFADFLSKQ